MMKTCHGVSEGLKRIEDPEFHEQILAMFAARRDETLISAGAGSA